MKPLYLILCVVLGFFILLFIYLNMGYTPVTIDNKINKRTKLLIKNVNQTAEISKEKTIKPVKLSQKIWKDNLFDPLRGELGATVTETKPSGKIPDMELIGVCNTVALKGAIILIKSKVRYSSKLKNKLSTDNNKQRKRFFSVDERLPNGYTLKEVKSDLVTLSKGNEQVVLKLSFDDNNSNGRVSSLTSDSIKMKLKNIKKAKDGNLKNKTHSTVKITPIDKEKK